MKKTTILLAAFSAAGIFIRPLPLLADEGPETIQELRNQIQQLDQKVRVLERKDELAKEEDVKKKKETPKLTADADKGFSFSSADDAFQIRFRGLVQADSRTFIDDNATLNNDTLLLRRARPIIEGRVFKDFDFQFVPDFGGTSGTVIQDAWLNYKYAPWLQLKAGKFKAPVGLELLQSDTWTLFSERALPTNLVPNRDIGFQLWGDIADGLVSYQAGVFNGLGDGRNTANADLDDDREFAGRIFAQPFKNTNIEPLKGFGFGVGGSFGDEEGSGVNGLTGGYLSDGQQSFFTYRSGTGTTASPNVIAEGKHWRLTPQAYEFWGPFGLLGEYTVSSQYLRRDAGTVPASVVTRQYIENTAWQIAAGYVLTGEDYTYNGIKPRKDFDPRNGGWGAFQIVARFAELNIDDAAFPLFATASSATRADSWAVGLNWYLNRYVKLTTDFSQTSFDGGDGSNNAVRTGENVVLTRLQLAF